MPELAEVELFRRRWNPGCGHRVLRVECHAGARVFRGMKAGRLVAALVGTRLLDSEAHGKQMLFRFERATLGIHLGMTGTLRCEGAGFAVGKHDHLVLHQESRALVFSDPRLFGRLLFQPGPDDPEWWTARAPAVLSEDFTPGRVDDFLHRHRRAPIKTILLNQECFPGIGNWMADEILWRARIAPATPGGRIGDRRVLWRTVRTVSREALRLIAVKGSDPPSTWLFPHRWRKGGACPRCGLDLVRQPLGGRTTCWCPRCQGK